ncbi:protein-glutamate O-methyltransferase CheR [Petroclostridium sp. X23]|uniref:CheR family methyltransferase n=1 Tax=Petroclostridium sp. X23 TaxID=3045146 RepID=UPI0024AE78B8|nr:protein-glutamate O-methyltransferase CheR [Petroclostridium sp. X23]WHH60314.1 protein-glutamate O-methyltransferase CheR [Petroclostridium sp. X23]
MGNINVHRENNRIKHVFVSGDLYNIEDEQYFIFVLKQKDDMELHVTFSDAGILSKNIVNILMSMQKYKKIKIFVVKRFLFSYLSKLDIQCQYIREKTVYTGVTSDYKPAYKEKIKEEDVKDFLNELFLKYGYDYTQYQMESIIRRIKLSMLNKSIGRFVDFRRLILENEEQFGQLLLDFSINTTEFFRDPESYRRISEKVLPYLNSFTHIKIWCAGCSSGQEPYSMAMMLDELGMLGKTQIYATDINPLVIKEAKNGLYPMDDVDNCIINYRKAGGMKSFMNYFTMTGKYLMIREDLKKNILFFEHSLCQQGILNEFHLILCRNVLIYFNNSLQQKVLEVFWNSLERNGFLVLGKSEGITHNNGYMYFDKYKDIDKIFKRKP